MCYALLSTHAGGVLIGACDPMLWPIWRVRRQPKPKPKPRRAGTSSSAQLELRRRVYATGAALLPVDFGQHRPRDLSAAALCAGHGPMQRLIPWIRRDLHAMLNVVRLSWRT